MSDWKRANTDWMHKARWGMMTHFLADFTDVQGATEEDNQKFWRDWDAGIRSGSVPDVSKKVSIEQWNRRVDSVNAQALAGRIADTGAGYLILTIGQTAGFFCSPNATYDRLLAMEHSRLSRRDLIADIAARIDAHSVEETLAALRASEHALAASKPPL